MLEKAYNPSGTEDRIYKMWEESGAFKADANSKKEPFTISMPPPNATGQLHLGHAVMLALEDIFIRFARMQGKEALWVPGTDHASIATESVVIRKIQEEEKMKDPRAVLGREELLKRIAEFVEQSRGTIRSQVRKMGSSCDWSREGYTLDPALNRCVNEVFVKMYNDGLIYRGHRIVNWDPKLQTTVSDDEIVWAEETVPFYTFTYGPFQISTARPETKFGDKYVVMHPDDPRYAQYKHGETFEAEWINGPIRATVIKDAAVDPAFGTGVMTITPWHDATDFEIAERHGLEKEQVIDYTGKLLPIAEEFAGMTIEAARPLIVEKLQAKGLVVKIDAAYVHNKANNSRGGGTIEPQIKLQWFIDVNKKVVQWKGSLMSMKEVMHSVVHHGDVKIIPDRFEKTYFHWIDNLRDWCISRQIWWGHRIPVWYKENEIRVSAQSVGEAGWEQDTDTLDTWFSSALWTWSTLVDPKLTEDFSLSLEEILKRSPDFQKFHPTSVMETGYDILFFWVARMILMTTYATGQLPFKTVYLHGLIRTREGKKMSKSDPKTMIDPLDIIERFGTDALRLSMIVGQSPGNDAKLFEEKIEGYRNFINKLWNASRFVLMQSEQASLDPHAVAVPSGKDLSLADQALLSALQDLIQDVTKGMEEYRLSEVGERLYSFVWDYFCDWYLELSKGQANVEVLIHALRTVVRLLHPYCPFVTEELWASIKPQGAGMLMLEPWPTVDESLRHADAHGKLQTVISVVTAIRSLRSEMGITAQDKIPVQYRCPADGAHLALIGTFGSHIERLARLESFTDAAAAPGEGSPIASTIVDGIELRLFGVQLSKEDEAELKTKLLKEKADIEGYLASLEKKLGNETFVQNAPAAVIEKEREKQASFTEKLTKVNERLSALS